MVTIEQHDAAAVTPLSGHVAAGPGAAGLSGARRGDDLLTGWLLAAVLIPATSVLLAATNPQLRHWFLIPVTVCGILIGVDAIEWLRRRRDVFDPPALLGLFGVHFYYLAPILHVLLDYWPALLHPSHPDWRVPLGAMALLNAAGLTVYRVIVSLPARRVRRAARYRFDEGRFRRLLVAAIALGVLAFVTEVALLGGPAGFIVAMTEDRQALDGLGWLLLLSESFPLLVFCLVVVRWRTALRHRAGLVVALLAGLVALQFLVGGLRGSRSSLLWPLVLALVLVHLVVFPITRKAFLVSAVVVVVFVYGYGLYKGAGVEVVDVAKGTRTVEEVSDSTGRDLPMVLLGDFGRADMQALVLERERTGRAGWSYGSTYLAAPLSLVPRTLVPHRPPDKSEVGTNVLYGAGVYEAGIRSQRVFGITGEAILNFGPVGGLASFALLGLLLRFSRRYYLRARQSAQLGPKLLCVPLSALAVILVTADLDNILAFYVGEALPLAVVALCAVARIPAPAVNLAEEGQCGDNRVLASN